MNKTFTVDVVATICTKILVCDYSELADAMAWINGYHHFTHELIEALNFAKIKVLAQYPDLKDLDCFQEPTDESEMAGYIKSYLEKVKDEFGDQFTFQQGTDIRTEHPSDSFERLFPNKDVIEIDVSGSSK